MVPASRKRATKSVNSERDPARSRPRRAYAEESVFQEHRNGLLLPAVGVGALTGIVVAAYLFWWQPSSEPAAATQAAVAVKPPVTAQVVPSKKTPAAGTPSASQAGGALIKRKQPDVTDDPKWRAAVKAQEQRVRAAAEERLRERVQAARDNAAGAIGTATSGIPQVTRGRSLALPVQTIEAPVEGVNPNGFAETPSVPAEQPESAAFDASAATPRDVSTQSETPTAPEPTSAGPGPVPTALQPPIDTDATSGAPEAFDSATDNGLAQPAEVKGLPATVVDDDPQPQPQPDAIEATDPEGSF